MTLDDVHVLCFMVRLMRMLFNEFECLCVKLLRNPDSYRNPCPQTISAASLAPDVGKT